MHPGAEDQWMNEYDLGPPLAKGRTADVFAWQDGLILKLFHSWFDLPSIEYEQRLGRAVHASGLPVPAVYDLVQVNGRNGLVYQSIAGTPMLAIFMHKPWRFAGLARCLAALHAEMHANALHPDLPAQRSRLESKIHQAAALEDETKQHALDALATLPDGDRICHGDFHPGNVLIQPTGAVIIDWIDASLGNPLADLARTSVLILGAAASIQVPNRLIKVLVGTFHQVYLTHYFRLRPGGEAEYRRWIPVVAAARLSEGIPEVQEWLVTQARRHL
jgi:Ser/Thr protein kinase RdoA (MazF antagonist)